MTLFPILERELRARSRLKGTFWLRALVVITGIMICLPQLTLAGSYTAPSQIGKSIFYSIISAAFVLSSCACFLTADSLSSERREGTLGLLLLTRVKVLDILLGKLGSIGLASICGLVAFLPFLMLPLLAGGVTAGEASRETLVLLNTLFLSLAAGIWGSSGEVQLGKACRRAAGIVLLVLVVPLCVREFMSQSSVLGLFSPVVTAISGTAANYFGPRIGAFWKSLICVQVISWSLLALGIRRMRKLNAPDVNRGGAQKLSNSLQDVPRPHRRPPELNEKLGPIAWLFLSQPGIKAALWASAVVTLLSRSLMLSPMFRFAGGAPLGFYLPSLVFSILSAVLITWGASRFLVEAARSGLLELLLSTPAGAEQIISGQWKGLRQLLVGPIVIMLLPVLLRVVQWFSFSSGMPAISFAYNPLSTLLQIVGTLLSVGALCWLSMYFGLRTRSHASAVIWSVALACCGPYFFTMICYAILGPISRSMGVPTYYSLIYLIIPAIPLAGLAWAMKMAKQGLAHQLCGAGQMNAKDFLVETGKRIDQTIRKLREWTPG